MFYPHISPLQVDASDVRVGLYGRWWTQCWHFPLAVISGDLQARSSPFPSQSLTPTLTMILPARISSMLTMCLARLSPSTKQSASSSSCTSGNSCLAYQFACNSHCNYPTSFSLYCSIFHSNNSSWYPIFIFPLTHRANFISHFCLN